MPRLELSSTDARLAYLALTYHLSRPGSELDPETKQPVAHGLREVADALEPQVEQAVASVDVTPYQLDRLVSAAAGALNELKAYSLLDRGRQSTVPAFHRALQRLFPEVGREPEEATQLAPHMMALRRKLERAAQESGGDHPAGAAGPSPKPPWWRFWAGKGG